MSKYEKNGYIILGQIVRATGHPQGKKDDKFFDEIFSDLKLYGFQ
jgi:hypothetical protein